ncbi:MAG: hypothetical protein VB060_06675 [Oscillibacter sp.]|nr:hypothetical protein [Oscillibacter sp.]MEA4993500.1 hypothetical protein [Oscillibacter sp.]
MLNSTQKTYLDNGYRMHEHIESGNLQSRKINKDVNWGRYFTEKIGGKAGYFPAQTDSRNCWSSVIHKPGRDDPQHSQRRRMIIASPRSRQSDPRLPAQDRREQMELIGRFDRHGEESGVGDGIDAQENWTSTMGDDSPLQRKEDFEGMPLKECHGELKPLYTLRRKGLRSQINEARLRVLPLHTKEVESSSLPVSTR